MVLSVWSRAVGSCDDVPLSHQGLNCCSSDSNSPPKGDTDLQQPQLSVLAWSRLSCQPLRAGGQRAGAEQQGGAVLGGMLLGGLKRLHVGLQMKDFEKGQWWDMGGRWDFYSQPGDFELFRTVRVSPGGAPTPPLLSCTGGPITCLQTLCSYPQCTCPCTGPNVTATFS